MTVTFTQRSVRSLPVPASGQLDYFDARLPSFGLRVSATGARSWFIMYRSGGRLRRMTLARFELLDLEAARTEARTLLLAARTGTDPATERKSQRVAKREAQRVEDDSFGALADLYVERHAKKYKRSWKIDQLAIARDLTAWRQRPARDITPTDVEAVLERIIERGAPVQANRTRAIISRVFNFGLRKAGARIRFRLVTNPVQGTERPTPERERDRVLSHDELRTLWAALDTEPVEVAAIFKLYLLTAQRGGEIRSMRREDLDLETAWWTIPSEFAKNNHAHRVSLSLPATTIVRESLAPHSSPWVFPAAPTAAKGRSVTPYRASIQKATQRLRKVSGVDFWPHDLRRTTASNLASMGVPRLIIGRILNHVEHGVTKVYDRHSYDSEKRQGLDAWARRLDVILTEKPAKVVPLRAG